MWCSVVGCRRLLAGRLWGCLGCWSASIDRCRCIGVISDCSLGGSSLLLVCVVICLFECSLLGCVCSHLSLGLCVLG